MSANPGVPPAQADPFDPKNNPDGRRTITVGVRARAMDGLRREALVEQVEPPGATFTLIADEPASVGGTGTAPTAIQYYAASLAFAMMSHVSWFARIGKLEVAELRMHVTTRFYMAGSAQDGTVEGGPLEFDTHIEIDSSDPAEDIALALARAERTCFTHRSAIEPVIVNRTFALNGQELRLPVEV